MHLVTPVVHELTSSTSGPRLDRFLADRLSGLTRSYLKRLITEGYVAIGGLPARPSRRLHAGDVIRVTIPEPRPTSLVPQPMDLSVVYEDGALLVVDKPPELTVHPGPGHPDRTLVNAIIARCPDLGLVASSGQESSIAWTKTRQASSSWRRMAMPTPAFPNR